MASAIFTKSNPYLGAPGLYESPGVGVICDSRIWICLRVWLELRLLLTCLILSYKIVPVFEVASNCHFARISMLRRPLAPVEGIYGPRC